MKLALVALVLLGALACELAVARSHSNSLAWRHFKRQHGKVYATQEEDARRFAIFMANKKLIESHNANTSRTFDMGLSHLSDWTTEEFAYINGYKKEPEAELMKEHVRRDELFREYLDSDAPIPTQVDWRKIPGRVTEVKDQGHCGSCWAFATTGLLEAQEISRNLTKKLIDLSAQQLVDCVPSFFAPGGCEGGSVIFGLNNIATRHGIESEGDYPYKAKDQNCTFDRSRVVLTVKDALPLPEDDEDTLAKMVATYGPVAVAMQATDQLKHYKSGVLNDKTCTKDYNHAVLIVGYGVDAQEGKYWIIKNSWGKDWGDQGYFKLVRGVDMCGITQDSYAAIF